jgi:hypothetical protein
LKVDYDKLMDDICDGIYYTKEGEDYSERILPVLKRHFEQFEKDVREDFIKDLGALLAVHEGFPGAIEVEPGLWVDKTITSVFTPTCPGIADKSTMKYLDEKLHDQLWNDDAFWAAYDRDFPNSASAKDLFKPQGQSLLEALKAGAENPVVKGDEVCPVCANQTEMCSYCLKNFEE